MLSFSAARSRSSEPKRVLHVLEATLGGTLRYLENIARATESSPLVSAIAYGVSRADSRLAPFLEEATAKGWKSFPIDLHREIEAGHDLKCMMRLRQIIQEFRPHLLHCHSSKAGALGRAAASLVWPRPIRVYSPHALAVPLGAKYLYLERLMAGYTDHFVAVSGSEKEEIVRFGLATQTKVSVVYPSIDTDYFMPSSKVEARAHLGLPAGPLILGVGRLTAQKDPVSFIDTVAMAAREQPGLRAIWVGGGENDKEFLQYVRSCGLTRTVSLVPWQHDIRSYIAAADVVLTSSRFESFGYMVAEALSMEIPVVATSVTGTRDIMQGALEQGLYPCGDHRSAVRRLREIMMNPERALAIGQLGRQEIIRRFSKEAMRTSLLRSYESAFRPVPPAWIEGSVNPELSNSR